MIKRRPEILITLQNYLSWVIYLSIMRLSLYIVVLNCCTYLKTMDKVDRQRNYDSEEEMVRGIPLSRFPYIAITWETAHVVTMC